MTNFLIDTDVIIWFLRGREREIKLFENLKKRGNLFISVITIAEVRAGLRKNPNEIIFGLKDIFRIIDVTESIALIAGEYKQKYRLDVADMLIAASAVLTNSILVTYNKRHFPMREIKLL